MPDSQSSHNIPSSGSFYIPSQASEISSENTGIVHIMILFQSAHYSLIISEPDSQPTCEGVNLEGSLLIIPWISVLLLLSKCQRLGCGDQVLESNMKLSRNGNKLIFFIIVLIILI